MQKKEYKFLFRQLGLSVVFLCGCYTDGAQAFGLSADGVKQDIRDFFTPATTTSKNRLDAPWQLRLSSSYSKPVTHIKTKDFAITPSLPKELSESFRVSANMPFNYMRNNGDVDYAVKIENYRQYSAEIANIKKPVPHKVIGYLDDDVAPAQSITLPAHNDKTSKTLAINAPARFSGKNPSPQNSHPEQQVAKSVFQGHVPYTLKTIQSHSKKSGDTDTKASPVETVDRAKQQPANLSGADTANTVQTKSTNIGEVNIQITSGLPWLNQPQTTASAPQQGSLQKTIKFVTLRNENIARMVAENDSRQPQQLQLPLPSEEHTLPNMLPAGKLTEQDKDIIKNLPPEKTKPVRKPAPVKIEHAHKNSLEEDTDVKKHNGIGIEISVRKPKANITELLEKAYDSLIAGDQETAISLYKQVLEVKPANKLALFGLATTYHRAGQVQMARPLYAKLLAIDPHNVEGLNNFLVLLADESPQEALVELGNLAKTHPGLSTIPAQMAIIYEKTGDYASAIEKMNIAINLSPENLKYRYNMAVILDKKGDWANAAVFYQQLLTANERGEKISANSEEIQQRLTFILSNKPKG